MPVGFLQKLFGSESKQSKGTALIVDDEESMRELLQVHMGMLGYKAEKAAGAEQARELLKRGLVPSVIVLDVRMNGEDGITFATAVRKQRETKQTPIVFVTGAFPQSQLTKLQQQFSNCRALNKPINVKMLQNSIESLEPAPPPVKRRRNSSARLPRRKA